MNKQNFKTALVEVLSDETALDKLADSLYKKIIHLKVNPKNEEERLVKKHVVFCSEDEQEEGEFLISKEVEERIIDVNPGAEISIRKLGSALTNDCLHMKSTSRGKAYLIKEVVSDVKDNVFKNPVTEKTTLINDIPVIEPTEAFDEVVHPKLEKDGLNKLIELVSGYENLEDYAAHLDQLKKSKLVKEIVKGDLPVEFEGRKMKDIKSDIMNHLTSAIEPVNEEKSSETEKSESTAIEHIANGAELGKMSRDELIDYIELHELDIKVKKKHSDLKICAKILKARPPINAKKDKKKKKK